MTIKQTLMDRSGERCELCGADTELEAWAVPPQDMASSDNHILLCGTCRSQLDGAETDQNHWRCLNDSMWSQLPVVQVMAHRMLVRLSAESWAQDLLDMMYLEDDTKKWAESAVAIIEDEPVLDCNGVALSAGDTVVLTKDLDVKGSSIVAKRGTAVRGISLSSNPLHIEGRISGQRIVIVAAYTKKS